MDFYQRKQTFLNSCFASDFQHLANCGLYLQGATFSCSFCSFQFNTYDVEDNFFKSNEAISFVQMHHKRWNSQMQCRRTCHRANEAHTINFFDFLFKDCDMFNAWLLFIYARQIETDEFLFQRFDNFVLRQTMPNSPCPYCFKSVSRDDTDWSHILKWPLTKNCPLMVKLYGELNCFKVKMWECDLLGQISSFHPKKGVWITISAWFKAIQAQTLKHSLKGICSPWIVSAPNSRFLCFICSTREIEVFLYPCGHSLCNTCREKIGERPCPFCRSEIQETITIFN